MATKKTGKKKIHRSKVYHRVKRLSQGRRKAVQKKEVNDTINAIIQGAVGAGALKLIDVLVLEKILKPGVRLAVYGGMTIAAGMFLKKPFVAAGMAGYVGDKIVEALAGKIGMGERYLSNNYIDVAQLPEILDASGNPVALSEDEKMLLSAGHLI